MGRIKNICLVGSNYFAHGIEDHDVVSALLEHRFRNDVKHRLAEFVAWSRELAKQRPQSRLGRKANCWEVNKCRGIETGSSKLVTICPVLLSDPFDSVHGGFLGGRACWAVGGTLCRGSVQGSPKEKAKGCRVCDFFHRVQKEEGSRILTLSSLEKITVSLYPESITPAAL